MRRSSPFFLATALASAALALPFAGCDQFKATTDRAFLTLSMKTACPEPVEGRAAGAPTAEGAVACLAHAADSGSTTLLLSVSCAGRTAASCKQTDAVRRDAEQSIGELKKASWSTVLGHWDEGSDRVKVFVVDTRPAEPRVSTVTTCQIVEGDRWAVCDVSEMPRAAAEKKLHPN